MTKNPGRVVTEADLASLIGIAWPLALTPSNIISGFTKTGIFPLNPGRITDAQKAPSTVYGNVESDDSQSLGSQSLSNSSLSPLQTPSVVVSHSSGPLKSPSPGPLRSPSCGSKSLSIDEILTIPKAAVKAQKKKSRVGLTNTAQHVSESPFLQRLRDKKAAREEKQKPKTKSKAKPQGRKVNSKRKVRSPKTYHTAAARMRTRSQAKRVRVNTEADENEGSEDEPEEECSVQDDQEDEECFCGVCEVKYGTELESKIWIECSNCKAWYHTSCVEVEDNNIPDVFMCFNCTS